MASGLSGYMIKKSIEKATIREVQKKSRMSEFLLERTIEKNYQHLLKEGIVREDRSGVESAIMGRRPDRFTSDLVSRLYQNGFTPEQWKAANVGERTSLLQKVCSIMSQELLLPQDIRSRIEMWVAPGTVDILNHSQFPTEMDMSYIENDDAIVDVINHSPFTIEVDKTYIENDDCIVAYGKLYHEMSILECRSSFNEGILPADHPEEVLRNPVSSEAAYADAQKCAFEKLYQEFEPVDVKTPYLQKRIEGEIRPSLDNIGNWPDIDHEMTPEQNLKACNPNYELANEWRINCQRCVPTYEMRSRGYDVTAKPRLEPWDQLAYYPFAAWENAEVHFCSGNGMAEIQEQMKKWGDGSRAQVVLEWNRGSVGHTFVAEQRDGVTRFIDPQNGDMDVSWYFDNVKLGSVKFCRTDILQPSRLILDCCKGVSA